MTVAFDKRLPIRNPPPSYGDAVIEAIILHAVLVEPSVDLRFAGLAWDVSCTLGIEGGDGRIEKVVRELDRVELLRVDGSRVGPGRATLAAVTEWLLDGR